MAELFLSDPHGEYEEYAYIVRSACGGVRREIDEVFGDELAEDERAELAAYVSYPMEKIDYTLRTGGDLMTMLTRLLPRLQRLRDTMSGGRQYDDLPETPFAALATLCFDIQDLAVSRVHVLGDVYDRGPHPDLIMGELGARDNADIQWGNHDILWMGASLGQPGCVANVVRICARYGNLSVLEDTYGIDLSPLTDFAMEAYADDPCAAFGLKGSPDLSEEEEERHVKIQKAMAIIQFKAEGRLIDENPSFGLEGRKLLDRIDYDRGTVEIDGVDYELLDKVFPTVDPADPYALTDGEAEVLGKLEDAFKGCSQLQDHMKVFLDKGSLYKIDGDLLLFHACVPLEEDGSLKEVRLFDGTYKGSALFDAVDGYVRDAFEAEDDDKRKRGADLIWYLWLGAGSPLFAKSKMATFELYFVADKDVRKEEKNAFYRLWDDPQVLAGIFEDFGMDPERSRIVCGHVPVKVKDGEDPVKCGGKLLDIDGGMSRPYQAKTGIAGFTLVKDGDSLVLATHEPFPGTKAVVQDNAVLESSYRELA